MTLVGRHVRVHHEFGPGAQPCFGVVQREYVGSSDNGPRGRRLRLVVMRDETMELLDVEASCCYVVEKAIAREDAEESTAMMAIARAAIDYALQNPMVDGENEYQVELLGLVEDWRRREGRPRWLTDLCAEGRCVECQHATCECPHHTGVDA